jgi:hypothetical protein
MHKKDIICVYMHIVVRALPFLSDEKVGKYSVIGLMIPEGENPQEFAAHARGCEASEIVLCVPEAGYLALKQALAEAEGISSVPSQV